ncbi:MAG: DJ-1/PfpI family protein [Nitrososphaerales archaeon]
MKVEILVFEGFDELDVVGPFEVFQHARNLGQDIVTELVSLEGEREFIGQHGLKINVEARLGTPDILLVPGGGWVARSSFGAFVEAEKGTIPRIVGKLAKEKVNIATVCTGAMLVSASGILKGRNAVTHHNAIEELRAKGVNVIADARVVDDGEIISAGGVTSGIDLALYIIERYFGQEISGKIAETLEYERQGKVWKRST